MVKDLGLNVGSKKNVGKKVGFCQQRAKKQYRRSEDRLDDDDDDFNCFDTVDYGFPFEEPFNNNYYDYQPSMYNNNM